jgi:hypothetical protein
MTEQDEPSMLELIGYSVIGGMIGSVWALAIIAAGQ